MEHYSYPYYSQISLNLECSMTVCVTLFCKCAIKCAVKGDGVLLVILIQSEPPSGNTSALKSLPLLYSVVSVQ